MAGCARFNGGRDFRPIDSFRIGNFLVVAFWLYILAVFLGSVLVLVFVRFGFTSAFVTLLLLFYFLVLLAVVVGFGDPAVIFAPVQTMFV